MNKYKDSFKKYEVKDEVKESIMRKIEKPKRFKLCYALLFVGILGGVSFTTVYAEQIKEFFKSWTAEETEISVPDGASVDVIAQKTNFDNVKLKETKMQSEMMSASEAEKEIGIKLLKYKDNKVNYTLDNFYNKEGLVSDILVEYETLYQDKDISEFDDYIEAYNKIRKLELHANIYTNNLEDNNLLDDLWFLYVADDNPYRSNYQKVKLENLDVTAVYSESEPIDPEIDTHHKFQSLGNELRFAYNGVAYTLIGQNMTLEEVISIANELSV